MGKIHAALDFDTFIALSSKKINGRRMNVFYDIGDLASFIFNRLDFEFKVIRLTGNKNAVFSKVKSQTINSIIEELSSF